MREKSLLEDQDGGTRDSCCSYTCGCRWTLIVGNAIICVGAVVIVGTCISFFYDELASSLTSMSLLVVVAMISTPVIGISILGFISHVALHKVPRTCRCVYMALLLVLFVAELTFGIVVFEMRGGSLELVNEPDIRYFLYSQLDDFYKKKNCSGGNANSTYIPISFAAIHCNKSQVRAGVIASIFENNTIRTTAQLERYMNCTKATLHTPSGQRSSNFAQAFCGSEPHIMDLAQSYSNFVWWSFVTIGSTIFLLMVAVLCVMGDKSEEDGMANGASTNDPREQDGMANGAFTNDPYEQELRSRAPY